MPVEDVVADVLWYHYPERRADDILVNNRKSPRFQLLFHDALAALYHPDRGITDATNGYVCEVAGDANAKVRIEAKAVPTLALEFGEDKARHTYTLGTLPADYGGIPFGDLAQTYYDIQHSTIERILKTGGAPRQLIVDAAKMALLHPGEETRIRALGMVRMAAGDSTAAVLLGTERNPFSVLVEHAGQGGSRVETKLPLPQHFSYMGIPVDTTILRMDADIYCRVRESLETRAREARTIA